MQITRQTEYAVRILIELAGVPDSKMIRSRTVAEKHQLPEKFLNKTVQILVRAGLIETRRGLRGGLRLAVPADSVTIADVLTAIEGKVAINPCLHENHYCEHKSDCRVNKILQRAQDAMVAELSKETFADLAREEAGKKFFNII